MGTLILVRHGRTTANSSGTLAGRSAGVALDEHGEGQAAAVGERLGVVPVAAVVSSPMRRCRQTARPIVRAQAARDRVVEEVREPGLTECDYGEWTGRPLKELAREKLWSTVQQHASAVTFPGGEAMRAMQDRALAAVRRHDAALTERHGESVRWVAVSHGDVIKAILADALGMHLDAFQRLHVDPASVSVVHYGSGRPTVLLVNDHGEELSWLAPPPARPGRRRGRQEPVGGETLGGGAGPAAPRG